MAPLDKPELVVADAAAWRAWLEAHHTDPEGVRLVLARGRSVTVTRLTHSAALEEALAFGWIDGQAARRDQETWTVLFTPRRQRSKWSRRNVEKVEDLLRAGRMHPAGIAEVERAKADGRWEAAYPGMAVAEVPPDLAEALEASPRAKENFGRLNAQNRFAILYRLHNGAARGRAVRLAGFVAMLERGETPYPQREPLRR